MDKYHVVVDDKPSGFKVQKQILELYRETKKKCEFLEKNIHTVLEIKELEDAKTIFAGALVIKYRSILSIEAFWVDEEKQMLGLGRLLFESIEKIAREKECEYIVGTTLNIHQGAREFWIQQGGEVFGVLDDFKDQSEKIYYIKKKL